MSAHRADSFAADARAARVELDRLLQAEAPALLAALPAGFGDRAEAYVRLLLEANHRQNLTRLVEPEAVARLHLLDALAALPLLSGDGSRAIDLGSGGGVPGLVLALARPDLRWILVETAQRKARALSGFAGALGLGNVEIVPERAESLGRGPARDSADWVTARACAPLPVLVEYALPLLRLGGRLLAWKGPIGEDELAAGRRAAALLSGGAPEAREPGLPSLGSHRFVVVPKTGATPARYPRRPGEPGRRPLG